MLALFLACTVSVICVHAAEPENLRALYDTRQWFALRDRIADGGPPFYRGAVALAFHDEASAEREFAVLSRSAPRSWDAAEAHSLLATWRAFTGRHRSARSAYRHVVAAKTGEAGAAREMRERELWSRFPDLRVASHRAASARFHVKDGDIFLPLSVNGKPADYLIDTGANHSVITEGEARRMGMRALAASGVQAHDATGAGSGYRMAIAARLDFGGLQLRNVPFLVVPDDRMPFANLPPGSRGMLGLPVLVAWRTIRWSRDGVFEAGFPSGPADRAAANLCFSGEGPHLLVHGEMLDKMTQMVLDTGAMKSSLLPSFASTFPEFFGRNGRRESTTIVGMNAKKDAAAIVFPEVPVRIGGLRTWLRPAELLEGATLFGKSRYELWLGSDLLQRAASVCLDFGAMRITLR
jgi:predicted aspartyl protease